MSDQPSSLSSASLHDAGERNAHCDLKYLYFGYHEEDWLIGELRSDHAGETGAVWIYRGVLAVSRDKQLREFCQRHLATETEHLALMDRLLSEAQTSRLLPLWRIAGFLTGAVPAIFGRSAVFLTINAVETFVEQHYLDQIAQLESDGMLELAAILNQCMADEVAHKNEAAALAGTAPEWLSRLIHSMVGTGSALAVQAARKF